MAKELQSARQVVGARVRERREAAGLTQAELAQRVYVSRQTVNNWETGKTLIDVQSLALVADELGTSVSELLGERGVRAVRAEAESRHELVVLLGKAALVYVLFYVVSVVEIMLILRPGDTYRTRQAVSLVRLALMFWLLWYQHKVTRFMREHDLPSAERLVGFLEGRDPDERLPHNFLYSTLLPVWQFWLFLFDILLLVVLLLPMWLA
ncbi:helix-turn-helix domain-containing protein [Thermophilibacter sp.]|uniref:helix-turn-helix domain-containing protein n=1 Tax=Thermophilibacter sp. TaxID=2847309 RepID=UPI003A920F2E